MRVKMMGPARTLGPAPEQGAIGFVFIVRLRFSPCGSCYGMPTVEDGTCFAAHEVRKSELFGISEELV